MTSPGSLSRPGGYLARFEGGPWHQRKRRLDAAPSGGPPGFVPVHVQAEGIYALAGGADAEGFLPYRRMAWGRVAEPRHGYEGPVARTPEMPRQETIIKRVG